MIAELPALTHALKRVRRKGHVNLAEPRTTGAGTITKIKNGTH